MSRYKVVGSQPVRDHQPGESFEETLPGDLETFLISIGALERLPNDVKPIERPEPRRPIDGPWGR